MSSDARVSVRVQPRAGHDEIVGERAGAIVVRVKAPPVEGRANEAVRKLIAKRLGVPRSKVTIVRGARGRDKLVSVEGVGEAEVRRTLGA